MSLARDPIDQWGDATPPIMSINRAPLASYLVHNGQGLDHYMVSVFFFLQNFANWRQNKSPVLPTQRIFFENFQKIRHIF
jgi:hypothetical protein